MINNFSFYLALRYLRPKRTFVSVITVISVMGVLVGVAALIVVISVMAGFQEQIKELAKDFDAHIEVFPGQNSMMGDEDKPSEQKEASWREVLEKIQHTPGVVSASPTAEGLLLVQAEGGRMAPALMLGIKQEEATRLNEKSKSKKNKLLLEGEPDLKADNVLLDVMIARPFGVYVGDKVTAYSPSNLRGIVDKIHEIDDKPEAEKKAAYEELRSLVLPQDLQITGIFNPPRLQDSNRFPIAIVPLHVAQELLNKGDSISSIRVEISDPYQAGEVKERLHANLPKGWDAETWMEKHKQLFDTVQNELEMMYFVLFFIVLVAAFCVMNTMITVTVQKRREIGIISALGSRIGQIMWVFLIQGMIVGALGSLCGLLVGWLVVVYRNDIRHKIADWTGHEIFNSTIYGLIEIPAKFVPMDLWKICFGAFFLCTIASLVPAFLAARTEPAEALRD